MGTEAGTSQNDTAMIPNGQERAGVSGMHQNVRNRKEYNGKSLLYHSAIILAPCMLSSSV